MGKEDKYYFCEDSANKVITFIEKGLVHTKGELAKKPFLLEEWQKNLVSKLFGWKVKKTGLRKYRTLYLEVPRKIGKLLSCRVKIRAMCPCFLIGNYGSALTI